MIKFDETKQKERLAHLRKREEEQLAKILSHKYSVGYIDLSVSPINTDALQVLTEEESRAAHLAVFKKENKKLHVAVHSPVFEKTLSTLAGLTEKGFDVTMYMASMVGLERAWSRYSDVIQTTKHTKGMLDVSSEGITEFIEKTKTIDDVRTFIEETLKMKKRHRISRIVEVFLASALALKASDLHVEPEEKRVRLRLRLDGVLTDAHRFDRETYEFLLSRIKLLSGLKLNVKKVPQDGRFSIDVGNNKVEIRTSVLPGEYGESIVLRLLDPRGASVSIKKLGLEQHLLERVKREIQKPNGLVMTTGPTGSGKTTALYAFLKHTQTPEIKIITVEDPIEYHLPGIVQTQVDKKKGYTFAGGLRSILRQDPDVILIGEIRDKETAETALNAALTGHLVFSTLHTNTAAGAFPRLIDLKVNPKVISSAINVALAQRLVRVLCEDCKKQVSLEGADKEFVEEVMAKLPEQMTKPQMNHVWEPVGCEHCGSSGYKDRIGVFEAVFMDEAVEQAIARGEGERGIAKAALPQGVPTLQQDAVLKALQGITSLEEVRRAVGGVE